MLLRIYLDEMKRNQIFCRSKSRVLLAANNNRPQVQGAGSNCQTTIEAGPFTPLAQRIDPRLPVLATAVVALATVVALAALGVQALMFSDTLTSYTLHTVI